jgi:bifunctional non-homologous end joining protein LigD
VFPSPHWIHEIKHDGYRLVVRRQVARVRLFTRRGYDWSHRFPRIVEAFLYAFDIMELNGDDVRQGPLEKRKVKLEKLLAKVQLGVQLNEHVELDGATVFEHACKLGLEGIVSKRRYFPYRSGRTKSWIKIKNPNSLAMLRIEDGSW